MNEWINEWMNEHTKKEKTSRVNQQSSGKNRNVRLQSERKRSEFNSERDEECISFFTKCAMTDDALQSALHLNSRVHKQNLKRLNRGWAAPFRIIIERIIAPPPPQCFNQLQTITFYLMRFDVCALVQNRLKSFGLLFDLVFVKCNSGNWTFRKMWAVSVKWLKW